jgi:hypothetical protein
MILGPFLCENGRFETGNGGKMAGFGGVWAEILILIKNTLC